MSRRESGGKGTTVPELDFRRIEYSPEEIDKARRMAASLCEDAADAKDMLQALGLMPDQSDWYYDKKDKADGRA